MIRRKRIVEEARLVHEQLGEMLAQPSGLLRASFPEGFANIFLAPLVAEFARRYPGIRFEFDLSEMKRWTSQLEDGFCSTASA